MKILLIVLGSIGTLIGLIDALFALTNDVNVFVYILALFIMLWGVVSILYPLRRK